MVRIPGGVRFAFVFAVCLFCSRAFFGIRTWALLEKRNRSRKAQASKVLKTGSLFTHLSWKLKRLG